jgi:hypothetical protein
VRISPISSTSSMDLILPGHLFLQTPPPLVTVSLPELPGSDNMHPLTTKWQRFQIQPRSHPHPPLPASTCLMGLTFVHLLILEVLTRISCVQSATRHWLNLSTLNAITLSAEAALPKHSHTVSFAQSIGILYYARPH